MKKIYRSVGFVTLILMCTCSQLTLAKPAPNCLHVQNNGSRVVWENVCDEEISVGYCSPTKPIWGRKCGDGGKTNVFYTHLTTMKARSKSERSIEDKDYRVAPCYGRLNAWDLKDTFRSAADGTYDCTNPAESNADVMISTSHGATIEEACKNAQSIVKPPEKASECTCQLSGKVHVCYVLSLKESTPNSMIDIASSLSGFYDKKIVEKLTNCSCGVV